MIPPRLGPNAWPYGLPYPDSPMAACWGWDCGGDRVFSRRLTLPDRCGRYWNVFGVVFPGGRTVAILCYGNEEEANREGIPETEHVQHLPDPISAGAWVEVWSARWAAEIERGGTYEDILSRVLELSEDT